MSVINQMLKDLEQRTPEQGHAPNTVMVNNKPSTVKIVVISFVVLLSINAVGFYIWDLQTRVANSELKAQVTVKQEKVEQDLVHQLSTKQHAVAEAQALQQVPEQVTVVETPALQQPPEQVSKQVIKVKEKVKQSNLDVAFASQSATKQVVETPALQQSPEQVPKQVIKVEKSVKASKMTVSRRQLTTKELVTQKLVRAEKAINTNQISKAEKLFEEVLILEPSNEQARKKLAALWFGRKSYQQAVNLLSQGIALDKQDSDLRMLKAQILLKQGHHKGAYHTLKALPDLEQQDYQVMLANVAQQIEEYQSAITAYKVLIKMQPYSGKWHLGLAIVYDKKSQFTLAKKEYGLALSKNDLSSASTEFATQRMQALGE